jgi:hypothetical protein
MLGNAWQLIVLVPQALQLPVRKVPLPHGSHYLHGVLQDSCCTIEWWPRPPCPSRPLQMAIYPHSTVMVTFCCNGAQTDVQVSFRVIYSYDYRGVGYSPPPPSPPPPSPPPPSPTPPNPPPPSPPPPSPLPPSPPPPSPPTPPSPPPPSPSPSSQSKPPPAVVAAASIVPVPTATQAPTVSAAEVPAATPAAAVAAAEAPVAAAVPEAPAPEPAPASVLAVKQARMLAGQTTAEDVSIPTQQSAAVVPPATQASVTNGARGYKVGLSRACPLILVLWTSTLQLPSPVCAIKIC